MREFTYVLGCFDIDEEEGKGLTMVASSNYNLIKQQAIKYSESDNEHQYVIEYYLTSEDEMTYGDLVKSETYYNGQLKETVRLPEVEVLGLDI